MISLNMSFGKETMKCDCDAACKIYTACISCSEWLHGCPGNLHETSGSASGVQSYGGWDGPLVIVEVDLSEI